MIIIYEGVSWPCYFSAWAYLLFTYRKEEVKHNLHARPMTFEVLQSKGTSHRHIYSQGHKIKMTYFIMLFINMFLN